MKQKSDIRGNMSSRMLVACKDVYKMYHPGTTNKVCHHI